MPTNEEVNVSIAKKAGIAAGIPWEIIHNAAFGDRWKPGSETSLPPQYVTDTDLTALAWASQLVPSRRVHLTNVILKNFPNVVWRNAYLKHVADATDWLASAYPKGHPVREEMERLAESNRQGAEKYPESQKTEWGKDAFLALSEKTRESKKNKEIVSPDGSGTPVYVEAGSAILPSHLLMAVLGVGGVILFTSLMGKKK